LLFVIPAQAGIQSFHYVAFTWFFAFAKTAPGCPTKCLGHDRNGSAILPQSAFPISDFGLRIAHCAMGNDK
ncbi:MAG: hypothetical protein PHG30_10615, partial [Eubacteriales bacterium]|nr:hypothetical protein [Eubacteriales bacterium]